jgi:hypothetical protein
VSTRALSRCATRDANPPVDARVLGRRGKTLVPLLGNKAMTIGTNVGCPVSPRREKHRDDSPRRLCCCRLYPKPRASSAESDCHIPIGNTEEIHVVTASPAVLGIFRDTAFSTGGCKMQHPVSNPPFPKPLCRLNTGVVLGFAEPGGWQHLVPDCDSRRSACTFSLLALTLETTGPGKTIRRGAAQLLTMVLCGLEAATGSLTVRVR